jgi:hypothetical protein
VALTLRVLAGSRRPAATTTSAFGPLLAIRRLEELDDNPERSGGASGQPRKPQEVPDPGPCCEGG